MRTTPIGLIAWILIVMAMGAGAEMGGQRAGEIREKATFAGGCFWCMEPPFDELPGVVSTTSGYIGGQTKNPTYEQVSAGITGHAEAVEVLFDPAKIGYARLLDVFWKNIDPAGRSIGRASTITTTSRSGSPTRRRKRSRIRVVSSSRS
jgi:methionine-S-sulfoxide reductase